MYNVKNSAKSDRIVYNKRRKPVIIPAGKTVQVDMDEVTAGRIVTFDSLLEVEQIDGGDEAETISTKVEQVEQKPKVSRTANELVKALDEQSDRYPVIMGEAKILIGKEAWPKKMPKKDEVRSLLVNHPTYVKD